MAETPKSFVNRDETKPEAPAKSYNHDLAVSADWLAEKFGVDRKAIHDELANAGQPNIQQPSAAKHSSTTCMLGTMLGNGKIVGCPTTDDMIED